MLLLAVSRDGASRCGLLCSVLIFICAVIGCVQGRRQSLWTAVCSVDVYVCFYWLCPGTAPVAVDCCVLCWCLCVLLLAMARDSASRCGLLCIVLMFMCAVIGCVQGRRQSP